MLEVRHITMSQSFYLVRHGGRKQHNLSISGHSAQNLLHILQKASAQHFICFVQHNAIGIGKSNGLATHMIQNTPRSTNNHMRLSPQLLLLALNILTAVNSQRTNSVGFPQLSCHLGNLQGQLSGRSENQSLNIVSLHLDSIIDRQEKSQSLACTGLSLHNSILAISQGRNGLCLYRGRLLNAQFLQGLAQRLRYT